MPGKDICMTLSSSGAAEDRTRILAAPSTRFPLNTRLNHSIKAVIAAVLGLTHDSVPKESPSGGDFMY